MIHIADLSVHQFELTTDIRIQSAPGTDPSFSAQRQIAYLHDDGTPAFLDTATSIAEVRASLSQIAGRTFSFAGASGVPAISATGAQIMALIAAAVDDVKANPPA